MSILFLLPLLLQQSVEIFCCMFEWTKYITALVLLQNRFSLLCIKFAIVFVFLFFHSVDLVDVFRSRFIWTNCLQEWWIFRAHTACDGNVNKYMKLWRRKHWFYDKFCSLVSVNFTAGFGAYFVRVWCCMRGIPHKFCHMKKTDYTNFTLSLSLCPAESAAKPAPTEYLIDWCGFVGEVPFVKILHRLNAKQFKPIVWWTHTQPFEYSLWPKNIKFPLQVWNFSDGTVPICKVILFAWCVISPICQTINHIH